MQSDDWRSRLEALKGTMDAPDETGDTAEDQPAPSADTAPQGRLDIVFEKKGRAGKTATIVCGFTIADDEVARIASQLKRALGCGGSARGGEILIQGDRRSDVLRELTRMGFKARVV